MDQIVSPYLFVTGSAKTEHNSAIQIFQGVSILRTGPDRRTGSFCLAIKVFIV